MSAAEKGTQVPTRDRFTPLTPSIQQFNKRLAKIAADNGCPFMDVFKPLADEQNLPGQRLHASGQT